MNENISLLMMLAVVLGGAFIIIYKIYLDRRRSILRAELDERGILTEGYVVHTESRNNYRSSSNYHAIIEVEIEGQKRHLTVHGKLGDAASSLQLATWVKLIYHPEDYKVFRLLR